MVIGVDFDGTCVRNAFPHVGESMPNCVEVLRFLSDRGYKLVLWSCREYAQYEGVNLLTEALKWFGDNGIYLYAVNENPDIRQFNFPVSRKCHVDYLIDDHALFIPRLDNGDIDWLAIKAEILRLEDEQTV